MYLDFNYKLVILSILVFISSNCAPVASDMHSAKLLGKGGLDITLNRGNLEYKGTLESEIGSGEYEEFNHVQENYGVLVGFGLTNKIDLRARIENISINNNILDFPDFRLISFGTKYSIFKDRLSLYVPFSTYKIVDDNDEDDRNLIEPTILFTKTIQDNFEINPSAKIIIPFDDMMVAIEDIGMAFNLGFGLHPKGSIKKFELTKAILRAEYGLYVQDLGAESYPSHITLGVTFKIK